MIDYSVTITPADLGASVGDSRDMPEWIANYIVEKTKATWQDGTDPNGVPWAPLMKSTIKAREKRNIEGIQPLMATLRMFNSMRIEKGLDFAKIIVDSPAGFHQLGTGKLPQRKIFPEFGKDGSLPDVWQKDIQEMMSEKVKLLLLGKS